MDFNEALAIVYTYAIAAREGLKEEFAVPEDPNAVTNTKAVEEAFTIVGTRVDKYVRETKVKARK